MGGLLRLPDYNRSLFVPWDCTRRLNEISAEAKWFKKVGEFSEREYQGRCVLAGQGLVTQRKADLFLRR